MQTTSEQFATYAQADIRPLTWRCFISFPKDFDDDVTFFTIGQSQIGGADFIKGDGDVVQEWDKYSYGDYSNRIISIEWVHEVEQFASVTMAMADVVLSNHDDYFTPGKESEIDGYILPYRPIRLLAGFGDEAIPVFIGLTAGMPVIDEEKKTATFHCIDFMYSILSRPLQETVMYTDDFTDDILDALFQVAGLDSVQLELDHGLVRFPFVNFDKDTKLGTAIKKLMEVEAGRVYMDQLGVIHFKNRQSYPDDHSYTFQPYTNLNAFRTRKESDIINVVEIKGVAKEERPNQVIYEISGATSPATSILIPAGESKEVWAEFQYPLTGIDEPEYIDSSTTSFYAVNYESDESGSSNSTDVVFSSGSLFGDTYKMTFTNNGVQALYITRLTLFGTPVINVEEIYVRESDSTSVGKYDERILSLTNDFFQSQSEAESRALSILNDWAEFGGVDEIEVKGSMALELDDIVRVNLYDVIQDYKVIKITNKISQPAKYTQILRLRKFEPATYFTIEVSEIGGLDQIAP